MTTKDFPDRSTSRSVGLNDFAAASYPPLVNSESPRYMNNAFRKIDMASPTDYYTNGAQFFQIEVAKVFPSQGLAHK